jgi:hypothetical protein
MSYIGSDELIFSNDKEQGIHSGGFSVNSILLKKGISPIITLNTSTISGQSGGVADIFSDLVVPNWAISYGGGQFHHEDNFDNDEEIIDDDLHNKLLDLVKEFDSEKTTAKKELIKKKTKKNKFSIKSKKNTTKKHA